MNVILPNGSLCNIERYAAACREVGLDPMASGELTSEEWRLRKRAIDLATIGEVYDVTIHIDHDFRDVPRVD